MTCLKGKESFALWSFYLIFNDLSPQAVNKLAEIMNRKDMKLDQKKRGSTTDLRKKEKENRKLQLELNQEKEKFNHMAIKYQKELNEMQAASSCLIEKTDANISGISFNKTVLVKMYYVS